jgi:pimeloyl-ACP methyl ester carboxylesterase
MGSTVSPTVQRVSIHGAQVDYRRTGAGPVLLLIHGIAGSSRSWSEVMGLLANGTTDTPVSAGQKAEHLPPEDARAESPAPRVDATDQLVQGPQHQRRFTDAG